MFYGFLMEISAFDIVPMEEFYDFVFPNVNKTEPINENFDAIGFSSMLFLYNSGSIMLSLIAIPLLAICFLVLIPYYRNGYAKSAYHKLKSYLFWNGTWQTINGTYTILWMCVLINTKHVSF